MWEWDIAERRSKILVHGLSRMQPRLAVTPDDSGTLAIAEGGRLTLRRRASRPEWRGFVRFPGSRGRSRGRAGASMSQVGGTSTVRPEDHGDVPTVVPRIRFEFVPASC